MKIDLTQLKIDFPEEPTERENDGSGGEIYRMYDVGGYVGSSLVGDLKIYLTTSPVNDFFYDLSTVPSARRPVVFHLKTEECLRGQGVAGRLIVLVNEITKRRFGQPLACDVDFRLNSIDGWQQRGFAQFPACRVFEKLEQRGLAHRRDYDGKPRWIMN